MRNADGAGKSGGPAGRRKAVARGSLAARRTGRILRLGRAPAALGEPSAWSRPRIWLLLADEYMKLLLAAVGLSGAWPPGSLPAG